MQQGRRLRTLSDFAKLVDVSSTEQRLWRLNLRHLGVAAAITRLRSVTAAARALPLSQPAVTQALGRLEQLLGLPLFDRHPEGMQPTPAALILSPRVEAAAQHIASPRITMSQLRAALVLADCGSYSSAAVYSGLAEPSLHRAIKDLSIATGQQIVERRGRGIGFTDNGRALVRRLRLARRELLTALDEIDALLGHETGRIAIGAMPLARARLLPEAIAAFHAEYPAVRLEIAEGSYAELIEPLRDGELDCLVGALRDQDALDLHQRPLFEDRPVILARRGHPLAGTDPSLAELAAYPWSVAGHGAPLRGQFERMFAAADLPLPSVPIESGSVLLIRQVLMRTDFVTMLSPDQVGLELEAGWLVRLADAPGIVRRIGRITRAGWRPSAAQHAFFRTLDAAAAALRPSQSGAP
jgi:DNA-binding transcriptional LysR family regulator